MLNNLTSFSTPIAFEALCSKGNSTSEIYNMYWKQKWFPFNRDISPTRPIIFYRGGGDKLQNFVSVAVISKWSNISEIQHIPMLVPQIWHSSSENRWLWVHPLPSPARKTGHNIVNSAMHWPILSKFSTGWCIMRSSTSGNSQNTLSAKSTMAAWRKLVRS